MSQFPWSVTKTQKCDWERAKQAVTLRSTISQSKGLSTIFSRKIYWQGYCSNYDRKISRGSHVKARPRDPREISQRAARCSSVLLPPTRPASPPSWFSKRLVPGWASLCEDHLHGKLLCCFHIRMWHKWPVMSFTALVSVILHLFCVIV